MNNQPKIQLIAFSLVVFFAGSFSSCKKESAQEEVPATTNYSPYIKKIFEYAPAPGQFINDASYGTTEKANDLIGTTDNGLLSLGGYGGYIIFGFDHAITNENGHDLGFFGNPLTGVGMEWSEPGIVSVMQDKNGNGLPDDGEWYELAGSEYSKPETIKNYKITYYKPSAISEDIKWTDNQGKSGFVLKNSFHAQNYFPANVTGASVSFEGTLLKSTLTDGGIISNKPFTFGYSDNGSAEYISIQDEKGRGYNTFDIDWAVDKNGNKVSLSKIDFVKVYTAQNSNGNPYDPDTSNSRSRFLGEISTEIAGAIDIRLYKQKK
ncbi:PKD domain-containing protein [Pedobacter nototheniae]|uniref:PKD domain-containing protein n=1 Tax=Pedobacter nototheniae TaxID=2488994 RepID=UPI00292CC60E|nr:PKD domain-containing protein [Pedobacter nototheniae]